MNADNLEEKLQEYAEALEQYERDLAAWIEVFAPCSVKPCLVAPPEEEEDPLPPLPPGPVTGPEFVNNWYEKQTQTDTVNDLTYTLWFVVFTIAVLVENLTGEEEPT